MPFCVDCKFHRLKDDIHGCLRPRPSTVDLVTGESRPTYDTGLPKGALKCAQERYDTTVHGYPEPLCGTEGQFFEAIA